MKTKDTRTLSIIEQELIRKKLINMVVDMGQTVTGAAHSLGINRRTATNWLKNYRLYGNEGLIQQRRGRRYGTKRTLSLSQEQKIRKFIESGPPEDVGLTAPLWTRDAIAELIDLRFGIQIPVRTMGLYLERWGYTPQRPQKRANERDEERIAKWINKDYPKIVAKARRENAEIHWGDETGVSTRELYGRGYSPKGKQPIRKHNATRTAVSVISSVSRVGTLRFMVFHGTLKASTFLKFLKRLVMSKRKKIFLIVDNVRPHHAKVVKAWLEQNKNAIELFFLPPYAPEINPDEYFNNLLKQRIRRRTLPKDRVSLAKVVRRTARQIQKLPKLVSKLFKAKDVKYAA
jgi:transposase